MVKDKILRAELIDWRKAKWIQSTELKELTEDSKVRLKQSIKDVGFIAPFYVWEHKKEIYILDGHHRQMIMTEMEAEGVKFPDKLMANFIECADRAEAVKNVLIYSSHFAFMTYEGLYKMLKSEKLQYADVGAILNIPGVDMKRVELEYQFNEDTAGNFLSGYSNTPESISTQITAQRENYEMRFTLSDKDRDYCNNVIKTLALKDRTNSNIAFVKIIKYYDKNVAKKETKK